MPKRETATDRLRAQLQEGIDALERGDFVEIDEADISVYIDSLSDAKKGRQRPIACLVFLPTVKSKRT